MAHQPQGEGEAEGEGRGEGQGEWQGGRWGRERIGWKGRITEEDGTAPAVSAVAAAPAAPAANAESLRNVAVIPLVFGNVRRFDPLKPVTHAQAAAALTFGRTYERVAEAAVQVEVAEARKDADVARLEAESARREATRLAEEMVRVQGEEKEGRRREREERERVEREKEALREEVERLRAEIGRFSSGGGVGAGGEAGEEEGAIGADLGAASSLPLPAAADVPHAATDHEAFEEERRARGSEVAGEGEGGAGREGEAGGGVASVGASSPSGVVGAGGTGGSIQAPATLPPGWWADVVQQRAQEARHGVARQLHRIKSDLIHAAEHSAGVASSLAASVADGSLQRSVREKAGEASRKVQELHDVDMERVAGGLKEGARMVREEVAGEVARVVGGVREEASRMVRVGKGVMDRGVREIREKAGYRWAAGREGNQGCASAAGSTAGIKKQ
ncbi:hypothetical protein CLOP_g17253 [Closterium sp. NIES-67]|nr:hypothetical protein CLOP_g17253 [Closterium sp. NIES-67]